MLFYISVVRIPDFADERYDVEEELLGELWFPTDHETFEEASSLFDEVIEGAFRETDRVTDVYCTNVIQLALIYHFL